MPKLLTGKIFIALFFLVSYAHPQKQDSIKNKNLELQKIKKEITTLEKELKSKTQKERESIKAIENIGKQNLLLNKIIRELIAEEQTKERELFVIQSELHKVESRISNLQEKYARYIVWIYKNSSLSMLRFILDAESFNQSVKRYQYLKFISRENEKTVSTLRNNREYLNSLKLQLEFEKGEKERFVRQKMSEQTRLTQKESERKRLLSSLRNDQKAILEEIAAKRKAEIVIKSIITKLIEYDRDRKNRVREQKATQKNFTQEFDYNSFQNFGQLKGNLGWPVKAGSVYRAFGENKNEKLKTVTLNYGIDIRVVGDQDVVAIAEGIVSAIDWIPGYGSIVIITHRDEHRTVYGHVANIKVKEGDKVTAGSVIGKVNESLEGNILHFEIWNERNYQNPINWLAKK
jgi:septal ring factor EnvC (AmiA/AmiB activator)